MNVDQEFAEGQRTMLGPGKSYIVLRHCEERSDEAIPENEVATSR